MRSCRRQPPPRFAERDMAFVPFSRLDRLFTGGPAATAADPQMVGVAAMQALEQIRQSGNPMPARHD